MKKKDFYYHLPKHLIAQSPLADRTASGLLYVNGQNSEIADLRFRDICSLLNEGDLLVFNNTKVIPARLYATKETGGKVEILVERIVGATKVSAKIRASKSPRTGCELLIDGSRQSCVVESRKEDLFTLDFRGTEPAISILQRIGRIPLPPYINRSDNDADRDRYQTVYAQIPGAIAAPTAGLHFDTELIGKLGAKGIATCYVTLHIGSGTFSPLRSNELRAHKMHSEIFEVGDDVVNKIAVTRKSGGKVVAVGTTVVRALESATIEGQLRATQGETDLFIKPGYQFHCVDALLTNFHLPESTLLILTCAFAGYDCVMGAYEHAVRNGYRFYSYGDAMFLVNSNTAFAAKS